MIFRLNTYLNILALMFIVLTAKKCVEEGYQDERGYHSGQPSNKPREVK